jgi:hypothetical protein
MSASRPALTLRLSAGLKEKVLRSGYCTVADLRSVSIVDLAAGSHDNPNVQITRTSRSSPCTLLGYPPPTHRPLYNNPLELKLSPEQARELSHQLDPACE